MILILLSLLLCSYRPFNCQSIFRLNTKYSSVTGITDYRPPKTGKYEITLAGGQGGGIKGIVGGNGGIISAIIDLKAEDVIGLVVGNNGKSSSGTCGGAGGGGGTFLFKKVKTTKYYNLFLAAPGGGGAGYLTPANNPDYKDSIEPNVGNCNQSEAAGSNGKRITEGDETEFKDPYFSYSPSVKPENYTFKGCEGGYGGGGQGGWAKQSGDFVELGGGGGGGGYEGGKADTPSFRGPCVAGGPGKSYCRTEASVKCGINKAHQNLRGFAMFKLHQPYKELPKLDRTNRETPEGDAKKGKPTININLLLIGSMICVVILLV